MAPGQRQITLKIRHSGGTFALSKIDASLKMSEFRQLVEEKSQVPACLQIFRVGHPPRPIQLPEDPEDVEIGTVFPNEQTIVLEQKRSEEGPSGETRTNSNQQTGPSQEPGTRFQCGTFPALPSSIESSSELTTMSLDGGNGQLISSASNHDEDLDKAIALSLSEMETAVPFSYPSAEFEPGPIVSEQLEDGSCIVRRFMDSDNSCLFTAVAYVMDGNRLRGFDLRGVIAAIVRSDPFQYDEAFLGRPNLEYCDWIMNPQHWGGEIELMILSQYYRRQIAAYDIQTTNCYVYGSDSGFKERVMLVYDGIHYDALVQSPEENAPEELDTRIYDPSTTEGQLITEAAISLVQRFNETNQFTNTATFQLRCDDCGRGFTGMPAAADHQKESGHSNFSEYK